MTDPADPLPLPTGFDLQMERITFAYAADLEPVLHDFSLKIGAGEHVAIIGESGIGKSTLVNLLARFWEIDAGCIRIGGVDVRQMRQEDVRRSLSVKSQHTHLFNTTLRENIRLARSEADDTAVEAAARSAHIHDFILSLPQGYDALVGENGLVERRRTSAKWRWRARCSKLRRS